MENDTQEKYEEFLKKRQKRFEYLKEHGFTLAEYEILEWFEYHGHNGDERLVSILLEWAHHEDTPENKSPVTERDIHLGLARLVRDDYLVIITPRTLDLIKGMCNEICGITVTDWPVIDDLDLTPKGYAVLREIHVSCDGDYYVGNTDMVYDYNPENDTTRVVTMNKKMLIEAMEDDPQPLENIETIGPWTERWWQIYPYGYVLCIDGKPDFKSL